MPTFSDSSVHEEDEHDLLAEYENQSDDGQASLSGGENENDDDNEESKKEIPKGRRIDPSTSRKHVVRNPIPKLDVARLKGPKGIQTIEKYFEGFKFHGKGHEKADLDRVMKRMEHWAHRLFPKLDFDDFLARVEVLGKKKELQVFVKKYRMGMVTADDGVPQTTEINEEEEEEDDVERGPIDEFDQLIAEQIEKQKQATIQRASQSDHSTSQAMEDTFNQILADTANKNPEPKKENPPSQMTDEIRERIERNRQQAIQRKLARMREMQEAKKQKLEQSDHLQGVQESQDFAVSQTEKKA